MRDLILGIPDTSEIKEDWIPSPGGSLGGIRARGAIVNKVRELGPTYAEYLKYPYANAQWSARLSRLYPLETDQRRARGLNARLSALLGSAADYRLADVIDLPRKQPASLHETGGESAGPRLFLGGDDIIMGLLPPNARVGDVLCQFWNSSAIAILRRRESSDG
ncbi:hypothetical protein BT63DRAFT_415785 [Microthyrium microscopicum]|uniref:Uncharacterized protein n=1 Tax=Microthyrium microscopicum TaxID=703497 RepID=A0A6A6U521_9PEZI|nr:hypothetical protein BT63DRAFT_415785 [Microthyrium microscopicum]